MKTEKIFAPILLILFLLFVFVSCNKDDLRNGNAGIQFKGVYNSSSAYTKSAFANGVEIESFKINISEIEFEFDDDDDDDDDSKSGKQYLSAKYSDIKLKGPFEIELMKNGKPVLATVVNNLTLPEYGYEEIEFEFDKNENRNSEMYKKTVLVKGTINGTPFIFWTDDEFDVEIEFDDTVYFDEVEKAIITVSFDIAALFDPSRGGVDISKAKDGNGNGLIEIHDDDPDGNENLADKLEDRLDDIIEAFEDLWND